MKICIIENEELITKSLSELYPYKYTDENLVILFGSKPNVIIIDQESNIEKISKKIKNSLDKNKNSN